MGFNGTIVFVFTANASKIKSRHCLSVLNANRALRIKDNDNRYHIYQSNNNNNGIEIEEVNLKIEILKLFGV